MLPDLTSRNPRASTFHQRARSIASEVPLTPLGGIALVAFALGCSDSGVHTPSELSPPGSPVSVARVTQALSPAEDACHQDPRVWSGLVPFDVCVGARLFIDETFSGNGRTCASCHPVANNFTIDVPFMADLEDSDPLFVAEDPAFDLAGLETVALRDRGNIKENLDGFEDNDNKFVLRAVPHIFSLATSITRDPEDGTSASFVERTGWSGDGVAGGALRDFANGAIIQHFPTDLQREEGVAFRLATDSELDRLLAFQLAVGRLSDLDLEQVQLNDSFAEQGRLDFLDPNVGRCNECHANAGANSLDTGLNTNFASGTEIFAPTSLPHPTFAGVELMDGGFGGQGLETPNIAIEEGDPLNAFGDGSFSTPPLIEIADTGPFFHHNGLGGPVPTMGLPSAVAFYGSAAFNDSPAGQELSAKFGGPVVLPGNSIVNIAQFLKVVNIVFNLDLATQRLEASHTLNTQYWDYRVDIQQGLLSLAIAELEDALGVLDSRDGPPLHPEARATVALAVEHIQNALGSSSAATRISETNEALSRIATARPAFGSNVTYELGPGTMMF